MPFFATILATERNSTVQHQDLSPISQPFDPPALASNLIDKSPQDILKAAFEHFGDELWIPFSGAEDVVLADIAWKFNRDVKAFNLDTGHLYPKAYRFIDQVREHYGITIDMPSPDPCLLEPLVKEKGLLNLYRDGHGECCGIRKIEPLKRKLVGVCAWATGQHRDRSPSTRSQVAVPEIDGAFSTPEESLYKLNPPSSMTSEEVWGYIRILELPYNSLHEHDYTSIGCEPYTRLVLPNQHEYKGRWWWEGAIHKECGLHAGNLISKA